MFCRITSQLCMLSKWSISNCLVLNMFSEWAVPRCSCCQRRSPVGSRIQEYLCSIRSGWETAPESDRRNRQRTPPSRRPADGYQSWTCVRHSAWELIWSCVLLWSCVSLCLFWPYVLDGHAAVSLLAPYAQWIDQQHDELSVLHPDGHHLTVRTVRRALRRMTQTDLVQEFLEDKKRSSFWVLFGHFELGNGTFQFLSIFTKGCYKTWWRFLALAMWKHNQ